MITVHVFSDHEHENTPLNYIPIPNIRCTTSSLSGPGKIINSLPPLRFNPEKINSYSEKKTPKQTKYRARGVDDENLKILISK